MSTPPTPELHKPYAAAPIKAKLSHVKVTQPDVVAGLTFVIGQVVAFVPSLANEQELLLSAGTTAVTLGYLIAKAIHAIGNKP